MKSKINLNYEDSGIDFKNIISKKVFEELQKEIQKFIKDDIDDTIELVSAFRKGSKPQTFNNLFSNDRKKKFVIQALQDLNITNISGIYIQPKRSETEFLHGFISILQSQKIIKIFDTVNTHKLFCKHIQRPYKKANCKSEGFYSGQVQTITYIKEKYNNF